MHDITVIAIKLFHYTEDNSITSYGRAQTRNIIAASKFHDIGKLYIPDSILNKPAKLTKEEFETIKTHTTLGADCIRNKLPDCCPIKSYAVDIALHHHEKIDGKGYPFGKKDIPLYVQIVSLADVYSALTSKRSYKEEFSSKKAIEMIRNGECGKFDEKLIDALECAVNENERTEDFNEEQSLICSNNGFCCYGEPYCLHGE